MPITSAARTFALLAICAALAEAHAAPKADEKPTAPPRVVIEKEITEELERVVDFAVIDDPKTTLRDTLEHYRDKHKMLVGVRFVYNNAAFGLDDPKDVGDTVVGKLEAGRMSVGQRLRSLLSRVPSSPPAAFLVRRGRIEVTPADAVRAELGLPRITAGKGEVAEFVPPLVFYLEAKESSLSGLCEKIAERCEVNVVIDPRVKEKADTKLTATVRNAPAAAVLEVLADMAGLAVVRKTNVYYITSPENAKKFPRTEK